MTVDAEKLFREALDEPAPPPPADPVEDDGDDHGHLCRPPALVVYADGGLATSSAGGTLLVAVWTLGAAAIAWIACSWLWSVINLQAVIVLGWVAVSVALASVGAIVLVHGVLMSRMWREKRKGGR